MVGHRGETTSLLLPEPRHQSDARPIYVARRQCTRVPPISLDRAALVTQLEAAFQGVKSCRFDLQGRIKVNLMYQSDGTITIDGQDVPFGPPDGWHMESETVLVLDGASCARWQQPSSVHITFDFPCDAIIPPPR